MINFKPNIRQTTLQIAPMHIDRRPTIYRNLRTMFEIDRIILTRPKYKQIYLQKDARQDASVNTIKM